jgi:hypothetical protein
LRGFRKIAIGLSLALLVSFSAFSAPLDLSTVPPFDPSRTYSVQGMQLEQLRQTWIEQNQALTQASESIKQSEKSFEIYKKKTNAEIAVWFGTTIVFAGTTAYLLLKK